MKLQKLIPITIMLPSIAIGAFTMYQNHISAMIWMQNVLCFLFFSVISCLLITHKSYLSKGRHKEYVLIAMCFLILTFISPGLEGVHRWISFSVLRFNVAMIVLPIILIGLWQALQWKELKFAGIMAMGIILVLFYQPDASQLTGFAVPVMIMLYRRMSSKILRLLVASIFSVFVILSWVYLDTLPPVDYVERILHMVADLGLPLLILGIISLVILPLPFLLFPPKNAELISRIIGFYYTIIIGSTLFGNFPVPLMGYGLSPIIGYVISINWYIKSKHENGNAIIY
ncbi:MAG: hypothetical protein K0S04_1444 [Herbinix sp.]|nr:hypothetical protein [Herbinix sp.]